MIFKAILKKAWRSPRGRMYPSGTVFEFDKRLSEIDSSIYNFRVPGTIYGCVVFSNSIFRPQSDEEKEVKRTREKLRKDHIKKVTKLL